MMHLPQSLVLSFFGLVLLLLVLEPYSCSAAAPAPVPSDLKACGFKAIYCFGDSIYDTGNNNVEKPGSITNFLPYGMTFGKPNGRFSDGLLIIDRFVESAGLSETNNPDLNTKLDHSKGANFAVGGTGLLTQEQRLKWNVTLPYSQSSMDIQLQRFDQLVKEMYKDETVRRDNMKSSLFVIGGGNIDYAKLYFPGCHCPGCACLAVEEKKVVNPEDVRAIRAENCNCTAVVERKLIIPDEVHQIKEYVKTLMGYGATTFLINGMYQGGCLPWSQAPVDDKVFCSTEWQEFHNNHNKAVQQAVLEMKKEYPDARIIYGDIWSAHQWLFDHAKAEGFTNVNKACCPDCGPNAAHCPDPNQYIYWDGGHMTDHSYKLIADVMIPQISKDLGCRA
ncbi:unnamed protein product [Linum trigynum]|uniref:GDSL esterase/lipase n=1 Tax=Linum trigynum TaxID=586398 RepID=A0AAV2DAJ9_9ROSI